MTAKGAFFVIPVLLSTGVSVLKSFELAGRGIAMLTCACRLMASYRKDAGEHGAVLALNSEVIHGDVSGMLLSGNMPCMCIIVSLHAEHSVFTLIACM